MWKIRCKMKNEEIWHVVLNICELLSDVMKKINDLKDDEKTEIIEVYENEKEVFVWKRGDCTFKKV